MPLLKRAVGSLARRLDRPELSAALYPGARQTLREEIAIRGILAAVLSSDSTYVDVGTNRGQVLGEAVRVADRGRHLAFEPIPALAAEVKNAFPDVDCRQMALGAAPGRAEFCHFRALDGWSGLRRSPEVSDERGDPEYIEVDVSTLDAELGEMTPALVKIDVEGAELGLLEGGRVVLAEVKPVIVFEHVAPAAALYGTSSGSVWDLLAELGYRVFSITGDGPVTRASFAGATAIVNWLATPSATTAA
ncbi:MAG TPA: FkbM family methyltransferase [Solirubrobacteraceae bacterium]|jgi:FkbM family methyltransferase|nr:FkbM family methyltransferase [Solirubrobacteraceae bacterium]